MVSTNDNNYKCLVKNTLGYSEICELNANDKHSLHNIMLRQDANGNFVNQNKQAVGSMMWRLANWTMFGPTNNHVANELNSQQQEQQQISKNITHFRYDLIALVAICCIVLVYFSVLILTSFVNKLKTCRTFKGQQEIPNTSWHFNTIERRNFYGDLDSTNVIKNSSTMQIPSTSINQRHTEKSNQQSNFKSSIIGFSSANRSSLAANYYDGSNGDSEHDIIQSCSQSSQYEDLLGPNNGGSSTSSNTKPVNQNHYQSQALYFNHELAASAATMNNNNNNNSNIFTAKTRNLTNKATLTQNGSGLTTKTGQMQPNGTMQLGRCLQMDTSTSSRPINRYQHQPVNSNNNNNNSKRDKYYKSTTNTELILGSSRVPLIDGTQTSRIKLDDENKYNINYATNCNGVQLQPIGSSSHDANNNNNQMQIQLQMQQQTQHIQEHIYDDVIYKKNIL